MINRVPAKCGCPVSLCLPYASTARAVDSPAGAVPWLGAPLQDSALWGAYGVGEVGYTDVSIQVPASPIPLGTTVRHRWPEHGWVPGRSALKPNRKLPAVSATRCNGFTHTEVRHHLVEILFPGRRINVDYERVAFEGWTVQRYVLDVATHTLYFYRDRESLFISS